MKKTAFVAALLSLLAAVVLVPHNSFGGVSDGKKIIDKEKCSSCHQMQGPAREKTIQDQLAKKAPELWYAGSKFKKEFLMNWLADPKPLRPVEYNTFFKKNPGNHPKLGPGDAAEAAEYLMTLKSKDVKEGAVRPMDNPKGRIIFMKRQSCYGCHEVRARSGVAGGLTGPTFIGASSRLNPDWVHAFLSNPKAFKPVKDMPVYAGIITEAEMKDLAAYVSSLD